MSLTTNSELLAIRKETEEDDHSKHAAVETVFEVIHKLLIEALR
jgi:hypothetical protein